MKVKFDFSKNLRPDDDGVPDDPEERAAFLDENFTIGEVLSSLDRRGYGVRAIYNGKRWQDAAGVFASKRTAQ